MRMDKYGRELDLILILTENASYTAQQIADRLGITRRNLYYYFDYLRDCGFNLQKTGTTYRLDRSSSFFRRLHEQISLSEYEAAYICRRLDSDDTRDHTAVNIRQKLARSFNLPDAVNPELQRRMNDCVAKLREAMATRKMVVLHKYASPHSNTVTDRIVEPYQLMNDERDVRCTKYVRMKTRRSASRVWSRWKSSTCPGPSTTATSRCTPTCSCSLVSNATR